MACSMAQMEGLCIQDLSDVVKCLNDWHADGCVLRFFIRQRDEPKKQQFKMSIQVCNNRQPRSCFERYDIDFRGSKSTGSVRCHFADKHTADDTYDDIEYDPECITQLMILATKCWEENRTRDHESFVSVSNSIRVFD
jgi:hypothetical protein